MVENLESAAMGPLFRGSPDLPTAPYAGIGFGNYHWWHTG